jgi:hypothetical protein
MDDDDDDDDDDHHHHHHESPARTRVSSPEFIYICWFVPVWKPKGKVKVEVHLSLGLTKYHYVKMYPVLN